MNELQIFNNEEFGSIRTLMIDDEPWFVGKDVADILGYQNGSRDINRHVDEEDRKKDMLFDGRQNKETIIINESGLYSLILSSKLPSAKSFKRWVTSEVLPSIRKNGGYIDGQKEMTNEELLAKALVVAQNVISEKERLLAAEREKSERLEVENLYNEMQIEEMKPKVSYYDIILNSPNTMNITEIAQDYGMSAAAFNKKLYEFGIQYKYGNHSPWILYSKYKDKGYAVTSTYMGGGFIREHTAWTQKGRKFLYDFLKGRGILPVIEREGVTS